MDIKKSLKTLLIIAILLSTLGIGASEKELDKQNAHNYYIFLHPHYNNYPVGFFAVFCMCLGALDLYENSPSAGLKVNFGTHGLYYDPLYGPNWWQYYFSEINIEISKPYKLLKISSEQALKLGAQIALKPRERGVELVEKYVHVKPHIQEKVDLFFENFSKPLLIGVHYRGTDKVLEARKIPYQEVYNKINEIISQHEEDFQIFVATDEQAFLNDISFLYPGKILATEAYRSTNGLPVHYGNKFNNYIKGEQVLVDCMLLSKCHYLIRTPSTLSIAASYFNPNISLISLE